MHLARKINKSVYESYYYISGCNELVLAFNFAACVSSSITDTMSTAGLDNSVYSSV